MNGRFLSANDSYYHIFQAKTRKKLDFCFFLLIKFSDGEQQAKTNIINILNKKTRFYNFIDKKNARKPNYYSLLIVLKMIKFVPD